MRVRGSRHATRAAVNGGIAGRRCAARVDAQFLEACQRAEPGGHRAREAVAVQRPKPGIAPRDTDARRGGQRVSVRVRGSRHATRAAVNGGVAEGGVPPPRELTHRLLRLVSALSPGGTEPVRRLLFRDLRRESHPGTQTRDGEGNASACEYADRAMAHGRR